MKGGDLLADNRIVGSFINIDLSPVRPLLRDVRVREDCFYRTLGNARIAIDAGVSIDIESVRQFMKCLDRANGSAVGVFTVNT